VKGALPIALRAKAEGYAGLLLPAAYEPDPGDVQPVATKINDIDINFGVKVLF
jgi:hypothetical protein